MNKIDNAISYINNELEENEKRLVLSYGCYDLDDDFRNALKDDIEQFKNVYQCLVNSEKEHKILQIIKCRELNVGRFKIHCESKDYEEYRNMELCLSMPISSTPLTEEEFETIKEWLNNA